MLKFFHGWRRKIGCVVLLMACVVAAAWVRSSFTGDYLSLAIGGTKLAVLSQENKVSIGVFSPSGKPQSVDPQSGWWTVKLPAANMKFVHYPTEIPYGIIVAPLLLLSAWLLLITPSPPSVKLPDLREKSTSPRKKPKRKPKRSR